jgi:hypothetical protein
LTGRSVAARREITAATSTTPSDGPTHHMTPLMNARYDAGIATSEPTIHARSIGGVGAAG